MSVSSADEVAVDGTEPTVGNGKGALGRSISDLPGPPRLPLLGNAHQLFAPRALHLTAERWAGRYGPIFRVDIGPRRIVGISDLDEINRILRDRPQGFRRWRDQEIVSQEMSMLAGEVRRGCVYR